MCTLLYYRRKLLHYQARGVYYIIRRNLLHYQAASLLHYHAMLLHYQAFLLHFQAVITLTGDYYIISCNKWCCQQWLFMLTVLICSPCKICILPLCARCLYKCLATTLFSVRALCVCWSPHVFRGFCWRYPVAAWLAEMERLQWKCNRVRVRILGRCMNISTITQKTNVHE